MIPQETQFSYKRSLCRFYLRGLCPLAALNCPFAHGIADLEYLPFQWPHEIPMHAIYQSHQHPHPLNQHVRQWPVYDKVNEKSKNYVGLLAFLQDENWQVDPNYIKQINSNRALKVEIRKRLHEQEFENFISLLSSTYQPLCLEYNFLQRQYYRVGFNKLMTRIKFQHLIDYLVNVGFFKLETAMPPRTRAKLTLYCKRAPEKIIVSHYASLVKLHLQQYGADEVKEEEIKSKLNLAERCWWSIPPLSVYLLERGLSFYEFLECQCLPEEAKIVTEEKALVRQIERVIQETIAGKGFCLVKKDILDGNKKYNKQLVRQVLESDRQDLVHFRIHNVGLEIIIPFKLMAPFSQFKFPPNPCNCPASSMPCESSVIRPQLQADVHIDKWAYNEHVCFYISKPTQLLSIREYMIGSMIKGGIVSVDLEGGLRNSNDGCIAIIQMCNPAAREIYILDYFLLSKEKDIQSCNHVIRQIMNEEGIVKVFHDCRSDSQALHHLLVGEEGSKAGTCGRNIIDTSVCEGVIRYYEQAGRLDVCPGLNELLRKYGSIPNHLKHKYHSIWSDNKGEDPSFQRPINGQFLQYCALDVLGLHRVYEAMKSKANVSLLEYVSSEAWRARVLKGEQD